MVAESPARPRRASALRTAAETLGARAAIVLLGAVASLLIARALGPTGRGTYAYPTFVVGVFAVVGHLSYDFVNIHFFSTGAADRGRLTQAAFVISGIAAVVALALLIGFRLILPSAFSGVTFAIFAVAAGALPLAIQQVALNSVLTVTFRMRVVNLVSIAGAVVQAASIGVLAAGGLLTPLRVVIVATTTAAVTWVGTLAALRPGLGWPGGELVRRALCFSARVHVGSIITILMWRGDVFIVKAFLTLREVGFYTLAVMLAETLLTVVVAITAAATPRQVAVDSADPAGLTAQIHRLTVILLAGCAALLAVGSPVLLPFVYGERFAPVVLPLLLLLPGIVLFGSYRALAVYLLRLERPWKLTTSAAIALAINVAGNIAIVRALGLPGVAIVSTVTYGVMYALVARWFLSETGIPARRLVPGRADAGLIASFVRRSLAGRRRASRD